MARQESDREDLMREATALPRRIELGCRSCEGPVTIGFRPGGAASFFLDQDPVYQFDSAGRLRRAYVDGLLYRSQQTTLARLQRQRTADQTILLRTDLDADSLQRFRQRMTARLVQLRDAIQNSDTRILRSIPDDGVLNDAVAALSSILNCGEDWLSDQIRARKI